MSLLESWKALPQAKRMQLSKQHGIKWFGISDEDLAHELDLKLPKHLFKVEKVVVKEPEVEEEVVVKKPVEEPKKKVKSKKKSKKK